MPSDDMTPVPAEETCPIKPPGTATTVLKAQAAAQARADELRKDDEAREATRRKEEKESASRAEARIDSWANKALQTAEERAEAAEAQLAAKDEMITSLHRRYMALVMMLILAVVGLAGYRVAGSFFGTSVNIGGEAVEEAVEPPEVGL